MDSPLPGVLHQAGSPVTLFFPFLPSVMRPPGPGIRRKGPLKDGSGKANSQTSFTALVTGYHTEGNLPECANLGIREKCVFLNSTLHPHPLIPACVGVSAMWYILKGFLVPLKDSSTSYAILGKLRNLCESQFPYL